MILSFLRCGSLEVKFVLASDSRCNDSGFESGLCLFGPWGQYPCEKNVGRGLLVQCGGGGVCWYRVPGGGGGVFPTAILQYSLSGVNSDLLLSSSSRHFHRIFLVFFYSQLTLQPFFKEKTVNNIIEEYEAFFGLFTGYIEKMINK